MITIRFFEICDPGGCNHLFSPYLDGTVFRLLVWWRRIPRQFGKNAISCGVFFSFLELVSVA